jgi:hypothetical protein
VPAAFRRRHVAITVSSSLLRGKSVVTLPGYDASFSRHIATCWLLACIGIVFVTAHHPRHKTPPQNEDDR